MAKRRVELAPAEACSPPSGAGRTGIWSPPELKPENEELLADFAYILGWLLKGDGCTFCTECQRDGRRYTAYIAKFDNKDIKALTAVNEAMARVLGRRPVKIRCDRGYFVARWRCKGFVSWIQERTLKSLKPYIEFSEETMKKFIQGYADCDGSVGDYKVYLCSAEGHRDVLEYARKLCKKLGMRVGEIEPVGPKPGSEVVICDHVAVIRQQGLRFPINATDFLRIVGGFNHSERDRKLKEMVKGRGWTPWPSEKRERVLKLVEAGVNVKEAAKLAGVPYSTARYWVRYGTRSWQEHEAQRRRPQPPSLSPRRPAPKDAF